MTFRFAEERDCALILDFIRALAEKAGVGTMDLKKINMKRITMA